MSFHQPDARIQYRLIDSLYVEAMVLADEARSYFDDLGRAERDILSPMQRVTFSCESLKVTTRLMHVIAWLLTQRAVYAGELSEIQAIEPSRRLGDDPVSDPATVEALPIEARRMIETSIDLHRRVRRLDDAQTQTMPVPSPARSMLDRLTMSI